MGQSLRILVQQEKPVGIVLSFNVTGGQPGPATAHTYVGDRTVDVTRGRRSPKVAHLRVERAGNTDELLDPHLGPHEVYDIPDSDHPTVHKLVARFWIERMEHGPGGQVTLSGSVLE